MTLVVIPVLKSDQERLRDVFEVVLASRSYVNHLVVVNSGDDVLLGVNLRGAWYITNLDISSCDTSNRRVLFTACHAMFRTLDAELATELVQQCRQPLRVPNPADPTQWFKLWPDGEGGVFQGSGWVGTTLINTLATSAIAGAIAGHCGQWLRGGTFPEELTPEVWDAELKRAALSIGYVVSSTTCYPEGRFVPERMELLKRFYDPERRVVLTCPGAIFRNLGGMSGVITGARLGWSEEMFCSRTPDQVLHRIVSMVVNGLVHEPNHVVLKALRERFNDKSAPPEWRHGYDEEAFVVPMNLVDGDGDSTQALLNRYLFDASQLEELVHQIGHIRAGQRLVSRALGVMYDVDYGLCNTGDRVPSAYTSDKPVPADESHLQA